MTPEDAEELHEKIVEPGLIETIQRQLFMELDDLSDCRMAGTCQSIVDAIADLIDAKIEESVAEAAPSEEEQA